MFKKIFEAQFERNDKFIPIYKNNDVHRMLHRDFSTFCNVEHLRQMNNYFSY